MQLVRQKEWCREFMKKEDKFLIIGANGLVGQSVCGVLNGKFPFEGTCFRNQQDGLHSCDITKAEEIKDVFDKVKPDYVLHCANRAGGVDYCQEHPEEAQAFHFEATKNLAQQSQDANAKFIYLSTECVFDGKKEEYTEEDEVNPKSVYGQCKVDSEQWLAENIKDYNVVRTMAIFGWQPQTKTPNALMKIYFASQRQQQVNIPNFRWGTPTYSKDLAHALVELATSESTGLYHVVGSSYLSRWDWLTQTAEALEWDTSYLSSVNSEPEGMAFRPHKVHLRTDKFQNQFHAPLHSVEETIDLLKQDIASESLT